MTQPSAFTYAEFVAALVKPGAAIHKQLDPVSSDLIHATLGIAGEAGEIVDAVKKHVIYGQPLDVANVVEELGDMEFYMEQLRQNLGISRDLVIQKNVAKLQKRYDTMKYSDADAAARKDKNDGNA